MAIPRLSLKVVTLPACFGILAIAFAASGQNPAALAFALGAIFAISQIPGQNKPETDDGFRIYFEYAPIGMGCIGSDQHWQTVNPALCDLLATTADELLGHNCHNHLPLAQVTRMREECEQLLHGERDSIEREITLVRRDGSTLAAAISLRRIRLRQQTCLLAIIKDITEHSLAREALRRSEEQQRLLIDNLPDSYVYQYFRDSNGHAHFLHISSGVRRIHGVEPGDILRNPDCLMRLADAGQMAELIAAEDKALEKGETCSFRLRMQLASGEWGMLQLRSRAHRGTDGQIIWDGLATDGTRQSLSDALINLQARRSDALLAMPRLAEVLDERDFMQQALHLAEDLTDSLVSFIHFVHEDGNNLELVAWSRNTLEHYCQAVYSPHYPIEQAGIWADSARQQRPLVINDYASAPGRKGLPEGHSSLQRFVSVPVIESERVRMILGVGNKAAPYSEIDVETVQLIGNEAWRIVSRRRANQALRIATQVVNASPVVCFRWHTSPGWPIEFVSDNVVQWGYLPEELMAGNTGFNDLIHPDDQARVREEITGYAELGMDSYVQEFRLLADAEEFIWVVGRTKVVRAADGSALYLDSVLTDISERKVQEQKLAENLNAQKTLNRKLEEAHNQLLQSEKMASIGQLAAGIAHELNNPIGFVHSNMGSLENYVHDLLDIIEAYARISANRAEPCPELESIEQLKRERDFNYIRQDIGDLLNESRDGLGRVRKIVQDLKNFSHVGEQEWQSADLHEGLDSTLNIVWNELKYKCKVSKEYGALPPVYCLISQLNQVFMNLLVNAGQAIEKQGEITIRTARRGENEVQVEIIDNGKGIPREHLNRIFEPFFTTKPVGKGTGLGLSLSWGIIERHQGRIEVDSEEGKGSCFRIILPIQPQASPNLPETSA